MKASGLTLIRQLKITKREIERRKEYLGLDEACTLSITSLREVINENIDEIIDEFYDKIISFSEMDRIVGDAETLRRLKHHQRHYILSIFDGLYDEEYVHSRLRIGAVHERIGVEPKFYVSSLYSLISILRNVVISKSEKNCNFCELSLSAIEKVIVFDLSFVFDTYIYSLMDEVRRSKEELENYTESLEEVIEERTKVLLDQARQDGLTNLLNQRSFYYELRRELLRRQRICSFTSLIYFDLDGFKELNDSQGHKRGDEILVAVSAAMKGTLRETDVLARYGGDEFCVILPETSLEGAEQSCKKLSQAIEQAIEGSGVSCSMGVATSSPDNSLDADALVKAADKLMYEAKQESGFSIKIAAD